MQQEPQQRADKATTETQIREEEQRRHELLLDRDWFAPAKEADEPTSRIFDIPPVPRRPPASHPAAAPASGCRPVWRRGPSRSASRTGTPQKRRSPRCKLAIDPAMVFLVDSGSDRSAGRNHQETARFPSSIRQPRRSRHLPSHTLCVGALDLASVSTTERPVSHSVRWTAGLVQLFCAGNGH